MEHNPAPAPAIPQAKRACPSTTHRLLVVKGRPNRRFEGFNRTKFLEGIVVIPRIDYFSSVGDSRADFYWFRALPVLTTPLCKTAAVDVTLPLFCTIASPCLC